MILEWQVTKVRGVPKVDKNPLSYICNIHHQIMQPMISWLSTPASFLRQLPQSPKKVSGTAPGQHLHRPSHWSRSGTTPTSASWTWCESAPVIGFLPRAFIPFLVAYCLQPRTVGVFPKVVLEENSVCFLFFSLIHTRCSAWWHIVPDWFCTMFFKFKFKSSFFHICDNWFSIFRLDTYTFKSRTTHMWQTSVFSFINIVSFLATHSSAGTWKPSIPSKRIGSKSNFGPPFSA